MSQHGWLIKPRCDFSFVQYLLPCADPSRLLESLNPALSLFAKADRRVELLFYQVSDIYSRSLLNRFSFELYNLSHSTEC